MGEVTHQNLCNKFQHDTLLDMPNATSGDKKPKYSSIEQVLFEPARTSARHIGIIEFRKKKNRHKMFTNMQFSHQNDLII